MTLALIAPSSPLRIPADPRSADVHPTAVIGSQVSLAEGVTVGPYCVLSGRVSIGAGTQVLPHTVIEGSATIGANCRLGPHAAIGVAPNHRGYDFGETWIVLGDRVDAREFTSLHRATKSGEENATRIGDDTMIMATAHVGHDCVVGRRVTMANGAMLGGHVSVGDDVFMGGGSGVHQFCRIGRLAIIGGAETLRKDVLPFGAFRNGGHRAYNVIGVRRSGMDAATQRDIRKAFTMLGRHRSYLVAARALQDGCAGDLPPTVRELLEFIASSKRGIHARVGPKSGTTTNDE